MLRVRIGFYGAETWTVQIIDEKHLESFEMWWWRRLEKMSWTDCVKNEVLSRVKEGKNTLHAIKRRKNSGVRHMLSRNCLVNMVLKHRQKRREEEEKDVDIFRIT
jgi:hypothetical protein